jgi:hypothetical protein
MFQRCIAMSRSDSIVGSPCYRVPPSVRRRPSSKSDLGQERTAGVLPLFGAFTSSMTLSPAPGPGKPSRNATRCASWTSPSRSIAPCPNDNQPEGLDWSSVALETLGLVGSVGFLPGVVHARGLRLRRLREQVPPRALTDSKFRRCSGRRVNFERAPSLPAVPSEAPMRSFTRSKCELARTGVCRAMSTR